MAVLDNGLCDRPRRLSSGWTLTGQTEGLLPELHIPQRPCEAGFCLSGKALFPHPPPQNQLTLVRVGIQFLINSSKPGP